MLFFVFVHVFGRCNLRTHVIRICGIFVDYRCSQGKRKRWITQSRWIQTVNKPILFLYADQSEPDDTVAGDWCFAPGLGLLLNTVGT